MKKFVSICLVTAIICASFGFGFNARATNYSGDQISNSSARLKDFIESLEPFFINPHDFHVLTKEEVDISEEFYNDCIQLYQQRKYAEIYDKWKDVISNMSTIMIHLLTRDHRHLHVWLINQEA